MPRKGVIPAQFLKHPPRSWKRDMPEIRREARADSHRSYSRVGRMKGEHRRKRERAIHLVPDFLAVASGATLIAPEVGYIVEMWQEGNPPWSPTGPFTGGAAGITVGNIITGAKPAAALAIAALAAKGVAKYLGINRIGTKKLKVF